MTDLALTRFLLFVLGAFALMLVLTLAFKRTSFVADTKITDWLTALFTAALAALTWALVDVASKQTEILSATDQALHLAAQAQRDSADTAARMRAITEAVDRAWIGPSNVSGGPYESGKPIGASGPLKAGELIMINVEYKNTGQIPASYKFRDVSKLFTKKQWEDGTAAMLIKGYQQDCMRGLPGTNSFTHTGVVYPNTGQSSYSLRYNPLAENTDKFAASASEKLVSGDEVYAFTGCFIYKSATGDFHHSFFCYFYQTPISDFNHLPYCPFGGDID